MSLQSIKIQVKIVQENGEDPRVYVKQKHTQPWYLVEPVQPLTTTLEMIEEMGLEKFQAEHCTVSWK